MSRFQCQTVQVSRNEITNVGAPSVGQAIGQRIGTIVELSLAAVQALQDWAIRRQVQRAIEGLQPSINLMLQRSAGVLICIAIEERVRPGGAVERNFRTAFIAGSGRNAREALNEFIYGPRLWQTPPPGFTRRESFIWVTSY